MSETPQHAVDPATLAPGTPVEVEDLQGCRSLAYILNSEEYSRNHGSASGWPWSRVRIVRIFGDVTPWPEVRPEDVEPGMLVEVRTGEASARDRVAEVGDGWIDGKRFVPLWTSGREGWTLQVHPDGAPAPDPDPDAALVEAMARAMVEEVVTHERGVRPEPWERATATTQERFRKRARAALAAVRAHDAKAGGDR